MERCNVAINTSPELQLSISYFLFAAYSVVALAALAQLIRYHLRVPEFGWTTQFLFYFLNFIVHGLRAFDIFRIKLEGLKLALLDLPGLLFFSAYTLLLLYWAEIYYQARAIPIEKLRPAYFIINGAIYIIQICIWVFVQTYSKHVAVEVTKVLLSVVSFFVALGFLTYGGRLFIMLKRFPIESRARDRKLNEVGLVTAICCACFLIRCIVVGLLAFDEEADVDVLNHPVFDLFFYMLVEIIPSALVLFILRKLPSKRSV